MKIEASGSQRLKGMAFLCLRDAEQTSADYLARRRSNSLSREEAGGNMGLHGDIPPDGFRL